MKVDRTQIHRPTNTYGVPSTPPGTSHQNPSLSQPPQKADAISVSRKAQEVASLRTRVKAAPEVRMDLVTKIKAQVDAGTYNIAPEKVAEKLLASRVLE